MPELPTCLLTQVAWMIRPMLYVDREEFNAAIRDYHVRIFDNDERWRPHERVLSARTIQLCFECWDRAGEDEYDASVELATEDPEGWTTLDLMFAVQQRVANYLSTYEMVLGDHCFFEGLSRRSADGEPPAYDLDLGS